MHLLGRVADGLPLLVFALHGEAEFVDTALPILITGIGKVNAALAVADVLSVEPLPSVVVNIGTAGALRPGLIGTHEVGRVLQHDFDVGQIRRLTGDPHCEEIELNPGGPILVTGDSFITDEASRSQLAATADLVDMEGYAVAVAARRRRVPVRLIKQVSDEAGAGAAVTWQRVVGDCARSIATWSDEHL